MNISKCRACGTRVSLNTKKCPNCGARVLHPIFGLVVAAVLLIALSPFLFPSLRGNGLQKQTASQLPAVSSQSEISDPSPAPSEQTNVFGPGTYTVGKDIPAGTYDCVAVSGFGVLRGDVASHGEAGFVQTMGNSSVSIGDDSVSVEGSSSYSNLELADDDVIYIEMNLNIEFVPK